jgi:hypothetical protein
MRLHSLIFVLGPTISALVGCSADADNGPGSRPAVAGSPSTATGGSGGASDVGSGGAGTAGAATSKAGSGSAGTPGTSGATNGGGGSGSAQTPLELPFFVNAPGNFVKSGFMGDAMMTVTAAPSETDTDGTCGGNRADPAAGGDCDTFEIDASLAGDMAWQGVFYQFPANNWGTFPGRTIASGATKVTFQARASRSVAVMFQVGMCNPEDATVCADGFYAYPDSADDAHTVTVGTEWTELSVSLSGKDYSKGVHGAFSWSISNADLLGDTSPLDLYLDAISWQ